MAALLVLYVVIALAVIGIAVFVVIAQKASHKRMPRDDHHDLPPPNRA
jgi:flagellar basal body-associated protein FliL